MKLTRWHCHDDSVTGKTMPYVRTAVRIARVYAAEDASIILSDLQFLYS